MSRDRQQPELFGAARAASALHVTADLVAGCICLSWIDTADNRPLARLLISSPEPNYLVWSLDDPMAAIKSSSMDRQAVHQQLACYRKLFPLEDSAVRFWVIPAQRDGGQPKSSRPEPLTLPPGMSAWKFLEFQVLVMAAAYSWEDEADAPLDEAVEGKPFSTFPRLPHVYDDADLGAFERFLRREERRQQRAERASAERELRILQAQQRQSERERRRAAARRERAAAREAEAKATPPEPARPPLPPVLVAVDLPGLAYQDTLLSLPDLKRYFLLERAKLWWVSNQSDDLLGLPYCAIQRLDYQIRTALRVIGPLRGRALLSDEVGLGKTIEAGLVIKEYLTRGLIKRLLILTVPSLVDQWEEELSEKFHLDCVTTNHAAFRADPVAFWESHPALIASLHTLKLPAHLAVAQTVKWDMLVVDEAHYLRNRSSLAWQAVNALPRQFLLLLTATPVQNSLEELYNLVTLLQPGQLPSPREFQRRFIDKKQPHRPREPEELRRLLGQIMIRNTRANAGLNLPPRRAETVLFEPDAAEGGFWQKWETELREHLGALESNRASQWGRLLLQAAGSSPAAWLAALEHFPAPAVSRAWAEQAPLFSSWTRKCELAAPLTRGEGGAVIFTQFLHTQAALAERLKTAGLPVWVIHGQTPAAQRQPITEAFRRHGGALLLTHSGTEGRNLQFSHRLVNFDLPWNPMEIEQRIGRLHRLGQQHPVRIYNFVQKNTLQEHLLAVLQEKLNLFELVVGETGLVLGERFSSDEFAEEVFRRWRDSEGRVEEAMVSLGEQLVTARQAYDQAKALDTTLFSQDYETL
jgi:superfamily II DNA or RNA helicase